MDAWIKTGSIIVARKRMNVAFLADAWIKINHIEYTNDSILSHPSRMRGLKYYVPTVFTNRWGRIPRGCVD